MNLIWATRGRSWGFRFLLKGGYPDPLSAYEHAFAGVEDERTGCWRVGDQLALRFPDPLNREDAAGRVIPHDFVVFEPLANDIRSVDDGLQRVWPLVADIYARVWSVSPPSANAVQSAIDSGSRHPLDADLGVDTTDNVSGSAADGQRSGRNGGGLSDAQ